MSSFITIFLIFIIFIILLILQIPVAYSMIITGIFFVLIFGDGIEDISIPFSRLALGFRYPLLAIFFFVQLGNMMNEAKISNYLVNFVRMLLGKLFIPAGRTGTILTLSCLACGPFTGSVVGTTTAVGTIMFPQMNKYNYDKKYTTALLAYSGLLGSLIPPSLSGLVYAVVLGLPVIGVWMAVGGVGFLFAIFLLIYNVILSKKRGYDTKIGYDFENTKSKGSYYKYYLESLPALIIPIFVFGSIYLGITTPTEAGAAGVFATLLLGIFYYKTIRSFKQFMKVLYSSSSQTAIIMFMVCASFSLSYSLTATGTIKIIQSSMLILTDNKYILLLITTLLLLVLGCFLDDTPIMILLAPMASAILTPIGIHPYHLATIFVFVCLIGLVTPPVGTSLYAALAITGVSMNEIFREILLFFIPAIIVILLIIFIPSLSFYLPKIFGLL